MEDDEIASHLRQKPQTLSHTRLKRRERSAIHEQEEVQIGVSEWDWEN